MSEIYSLIEILRGIKGASGRAINQFLQRHGPVWQEESFDHVLRSSESMDAKAAYILENPVRKGSPADHVAPDPLVRGFEGTIYARSLRSRGGAMAPPLHGLFWIPDWEF